MLGSEDVMVNSNPQPPGSFPHATRVAAHGKQAAPFSRLLRHARGSEDVFYPDVLTGKTLIQHQTYLTNCETKISYDGSMGTSPINKAELTIGNPKSLRFCECVYELMSLLITFIFKFKKEVSLSVVFDLTN